MHTAHIVVHEWTVMRMRLIDLDELLKFPIRLDHYDKEHGDVNFVYGIESIIEYAEELPTVDAIVVRHGRWRVEEEQPEYNDTVLCDCSICGARVEMGVSDFETNDVKWCWKCGARMDGDKHAER